MKLSPLQCPSTGLQITMELHQTPQQARTWRIQSTAICTTEFNSSMEDAFERDPRHSCKHVQRRFHTSALCAGKQRVFVRIVTFNTYPDEAIGLHYALFTLFTFFTALLSSLLHSLHFCTCCPPRPSSLI